MSTCRCRGSPSAVCLSIAAVVNRDLLPAALARAERDAAFLAEGIPEAAKRDLVSRLSLGLFARSFRSDGLGRGGLPSFEVRSPTARTTFLSPSRLLFLALPPPPLPRVRGETRGSRNGKVAVVVDTCYDRIHLDTPMTVEAGLCHDCCEWFASHLSFVEIQKRCVMDDVRVYSIQRGASCIFTKSLMPCHAKARHCGLKLSLRRLS